MSQAAIDLPGSLRSTIEQALRQGDTKAAVERIKQDLSQCIRDGALRLPARFRQTRADTYARRLVYRDPELRTTAVAMTWGPGQATAIHDHAGIWCVEGVVEGEMNVTQYELEQQSEELFRFHQRDCIHAGVGSSGCLIPPYEYHVLANAIEDVSITLHIYGGEMDHCNIYLPRPDGLYERKARVMTYDE
jgi:predicted metal-dependent enzyme (double-stranded beta helix superfamily)